MEFDSNDEQQQGDEHDALLLSQNKPPKNIEKWVKDRCAQGIEMIEACFQDTYQDVKNTAIHILNGMYRVCETEMGDMPRRHAENGGTYVDGTRYVYKEGQSDRFQNRYSTLASASAWACFALQQAYFEENNYTFECGNKDLADDWQVRNLHETLVHFRGDVFSATSPQDPSAVAHTLVGAKGLNGAADMVNKAACGETRRKLRIDPLGNQVDCEKKAHTFKHVFELTYGSTRTFCDEICKLAAPSTSPQVQASGSRSQTTKQKKAAGYKDNVDSKLAPRSTPPPHSSVGSNVAHGETNCPQKPRADPVILVAKGITDAKEKARKEAEKKKKCEQLQDSNKVEALIASKGIRSMQCRDTENERVADVLSKAAGKNRMLRTTIKGMVTVACSNVVKRRVYESNTEAADAEYDRRVADVNKKRAEFQDIDTKCRYGLDCEDDKQWGTLIPDYELTLSEEELKIHQGGQPPDVYRADIRASYNVSEPKYQQFKAKKPRRLMEPGEAYDYATVFGFQSTRDARAELDHIRAALKSGQGLGDFEPWRVWMYHFMVGLSANAPRMKLDQDRYEEHLKQVSDRRKQGPDKKELKYDESGNVTNQYQVDKSNESRKKRQASAAGVKQRKRANEEVKKQNDQDKAEKKQRGKDEREEKATYNKLAAAMQKDTNKRAREEKCKQKEEALDTKRKDEGNRARANYEQKQHNLANSKSSPGRRKTPVLVRKPVVDDKGYVIKDANPVWVEAMIPDYTHPAIPTSDNFDGWKDDNGNKLDRPLSICIKVSGYSRFMEKKERDALPDAEKDHCSIKYKYDNGQPIHVAADLEPPPVYRKFVFIKHTKQNPNGVCTGIVRYASDWPVLKAGTPEEKRMRKKLEKSGKLCKA